MPIELDAGDVTVGKWEPFGPSGALMVCGTTSNAGKSTLAAGLCRHYARRGARVAPFKGQNMSNNSAVTPGGHEIARAQAWQAAAAGTDPEVGMNPVLVKPMGERRCQVVVMGRPVGTMTASEFHRMKPELLGIVLEALADLRRRYDVVILEGAGSPAEVNLMESDIVNLRLAAEAGIGAVLVGDIELGGVFASLFGTLALLPPAHRRLVKGLVVNKFRGDPALFAGGAEQLEERCGVPCLGVLPWIEGPETDSEDSLALDRPLQLEPGAADGVEAGEPTGVLDVAVVRLPHIANFTDLDPLRFEPGVRLRWVEDARSLGEPDLLVIPGSKATVADLAWLRSRGLDHAAAAAKGVVLGICAGYQMLGGTIADPGGVESCEPQVDGLGLLDAVTTFGPEKVVRQRRGRLFGEPAAGYQIHHGVVKSSGRALVELDNGEGDGAAGTTPAGALVWGTSLHGLLDEDGARSALLEKVAARAGTAIPHGGCFEAARQRRIDLLADLVEEHLDLARLDQVLAEGVRA